MRQRKENISLYFKRWIEIFISVNHFRFGKFDGLTLITFWLKRHLVDYQRIKLSPPLVLQKMMEKYYKLWKVKKKHWKFLATLTQKVHSHILKFNYIHY